MLVKHFHRTILRMLPGPFLGWLGMLLFLLLMQFLIRYLPDIVGKGLPPGVLVELVAYNLAYMVVLAVPMSALIASLMAFGRLAETNGYMIVQSAGVSLPRLVWPTAVVGLALTAGMLYFNNEVLPEANFRARNLWQDIHRKKPAFQLQPGVFFDGITGYDILVQDITPDSSVLVDVLVYDHTGSTSAPVTIKATRGRILPGAGAAIDLVLDRGEMHRPRLSPTDGTERYERLAFDRIRFRLDLSDFDFERTDPKEGFRTDRTMRTIDMVRFVDSLRTGIETRRRRVVERAMALGTGAVAFDAPSDAAPPPSFDAMTADTVFRRDVAPDPLDFEVLASDTVGTAIRQARIIRSDLDDTRRAYDWDTQRADRYLVEIHKKYSIGVACLIFMLIGAPLGLRIRRGGLGTAGALAVGIFLFYWVTLVQGEKLADRGLLAPWFGMWIANLVMIAAALWLLLYVWLDLRATPRLLSRLRRPKTRAPEEPAALV